MDPKRLQAGRSTDSTAGWAAALGVWARLAQSSEGEGCSSEGVGSAGLHHMLCTQLQPPQATKGGAFSEGEEERGGRWGKAARACACASSTPNWQAWPAGACAACACADDGAIRHVRNC